jgi:hypothetical protein
MEIKFNQLAFTKEFQKLEKAFKQLLQNSQRDAEEILQQQARLFCMDLIHVTQPFGKSLKSKRTGENAVGRDIGRVYLTEHDLYKMIRKTSKEQAGAFYYHVKKGDYVTASKIASSLNIKIEGFDGGKEHKQNRKAGRVRRPVKKKFAPVKDVRKYATEVQKRVGFAKAGWAHAAAKLGTGRVPAWIKRHKGNLGTAVVGKRGNISQVTIINNVSYIGKLVDNYHILKALNTRARAIEKLVKKVIEINAKQTQVIK